MEVAVRALSSLYGDYGRVVEGQVFSLPERDARKLEMRGKVQRIVPRTFPPRETTAFVVPERKAADLPAVALPVSGHRVPAGDPMVSCIMPTADRKAYVSGAVRSFLAQDYPNKELIVLDDGRQPVKPLLPQDPRVRYVHSSQRRTVGEKRNAACEMAVGQLICHWDDDDRSSITRLSDQVRFMQMQQKPVVGYRSILFWDADGREMYEYAGTPGKPGNSTALGTSLCYLKSWWREHRFDDVNVCEDERFVAAAGSNIAVADGREMIVAYVHPKSASPKPLNCAPFQKVARLLPSWAGR